MKITRLKFAYLCLCAAVSTSCAKTGPNQGGSPLDTSSSTTTLDTAYESTGIDILNSAMWFKLDASVTIGRGIVTSTTLTVSTFAEPDEEPICVGTVDINSSDPGDSPDEIIDTWWVVDWDISTLACSTAARMPEKLMLGMGELHEDLEPYLSNSGVTNSQGGAYVSFGELDNTEELRVYAYGYLTYSGDDETTINEPVNDSAIPSDSTDRNDGPWELHGVFLFPLNPIAE